jgi:hypothetical protein
MGNLVKVRLVEAWRGYSANSQVTMTEKAYFKHKADGVKMVLVTGLIKTAPPERPIPKIDYERLHDKPFIIDEEE